MKVSIKFTMHINDSESSQCYPGATLQLASDKFHNLVNLSVTSVKINLEEIQHNNCICFTFTYKINHKDSSFNNLSCFIRIITQFNIWKSSWLCHKPVTDIHFYCKKRQQIFFNGFTYFIYRFLLVTSLEDSAPP